MLKSGSARDIRYMVYYVYLNSMMNHLFIVGSGWWWEWVFHDSREYLGTLNSLILVCGFKICGSTFSECNFGTIVNTVRQSYPCTVWRVPLFGFWVRPQIDSVWALSWATQSWAKLRFLILVGSRIFK